MKFPRQCVRTVPSGSVWYTTRWIETLGLGFSVVFVVALSQTSTASCTQATEASLVLSLWSLPLVLSKERFHFHRRRIVH